MGRDDAPIFGENGRRAGLLVAVPGLAAEGAVARGDAAAGALQTTGHRGGSVGDGSRERASPHHEVAIVEGDRHVERTHAVASGGAGPHPVQLPVAFHHQRVVLHRPQEQEITALAPADLGPARVGAARVGSVYFPHALQGTGGRAGAGVAGARIAVRADAAIARRHALLIGRRRAAAPEGRERQESEGKGDRARAAGVHGRGLTRHPRCATYMWVFRPVFNLPQSRNVPHESYACSMHAIRTPASRDR